MATYSIGIDLGTTNSVLSYTPCEGGALSIMPIPQYVDAGVIESRQSLPSFMYLGTENETFTLPWQTTTSSTVIGAFARKRASQVPDRTIAAAKSWLAHTKVDGRSNLLPVNAPDGLQKQSAFSVTRDILAYFVAAWNNAHTDALFNQQHIVITVPASFDEVARDLTREAARAAGFPETFTMLEEPQAALYSWLESKGDSWRKELTAGDSLLVVDIGGGTSDFSLIKASESDGQLGLNRVAVGKHLLVGGDNMDLAVAHLAAQQFSQQGTTLDAWQNVALWHSCRDAKENLLGEEKNATHTIAIQGKGRSVIGSSISTQLDKQVIQDFLVNGFFPETDFNAPLQQAASGFVQVGLAYESDAAITRHLASFLREHAEEVGGAVTHILFNGGVFKAGIFQGRILSSIEKWLGSRPALLDSSADLDCSVARGASHYSVVRETGGLRIRGGTARSYYLGFETATMAIPGMPKPMQGLCVVARGMEEGTSVSIPSAPLGLIVGQRASFPFFSSTLRPDDEVGTLLPSIGPDVETADTIVADLPTQGREVGEVVTIRLEANLQETGALELWAVSVDDEQRWKFEFNAREE